jgi:excinuclease ABC subunit C
MSEAQGIAAPSDATGLKGAELIRAQVRRLPNGPGVYRMRDARGDVLYVGKAKSLKKRVVAYTKPQALSARLQRMVALTRSMEFVTCASEVEALLLEANLIKRFRPGFNIILRDDKSFPYIYLTRGDRFARIGRYRGARTPDREIYGPFASAGAIDETLNALLRAFPLRTCSNSIFESRTRPCLQFQIKRCSAPCVGRIADDAYAELVQGVRDFLSGRSQQVQERLKAAMLEASETLAFEQAAALRDRLKALAHITSRQGINTSAVGDADVIGLHRDGGQACVQVFFYRNGRNYGNRAYYPAQTRDAAPGELIEAFIGQFYAERVPPSLVLLSDAAPQAELVAEALSVRAGRRVHLTVPRRGDRRHLVEIAVSNARQALARRLAESAAQGRLLRRLAEVIDMPEPPARIEVYDNSHIQGAHAVGAFVVSGPDGFVKPAYRTFNIKTADLAPGDDYAMMREVLHRRFGRLMREDPERGSGQWPDLVVIDGGAGQLSAALSTLADLGISDLPLMAVAKGPDRDAGRERLHLPDRDPVALDPRNPVLYFVQRLRDEAHRFAVSTHRARRGKAIGRSTLDRVAGVGAKRKRALLSHFGSARAIEQAGLLDLEQVPGISRAVARAVYDHFHDGG